MAQVMGRSEAGDGSGYGLGLGFGFGVRWRLDATGEPV
jgi:hypothetical protein